VDGRLGEFSQTSFFIADGFMLIFRRNKATEISQWQRSKDFSMTADIDAKLPERPSLEGYKVEVLSLDSVVHLFKKRGQYHDQSELRHRARLMASE
jgi:hypothetical protein